MLYYLVQTNFIDLTIVLFSYIFLLTNRTFDKKQTSVFLTACVIVNILIIADSLDYYFKSFSQPVVYRYFTSATGYTFRPIGIIMILLNLKQKEDDRRHMYLIFVPAAINMLLAYTSVFTHWMFYYDESNEFHRGPIGVLPFLISGIYMLDLTVRGLQKYRMGNRKESAVLLMVAFMAVVSVCMETFLHFKFIINGVGAISIVFYYLFLHTQTFKRDALTGALNRHAFYLDTTRFQKRSMYIVSIDLNNLKEINDQKGHQEGDKAILTVANGLFSWMRSGCELYRMGGDEFTMLCPKLNEMEVRALMSSAASWIESQGYQIAWGMAYYKQGTKFEKVLSLSDERMYQDKKMKKKGQVR